MAHILVADLELGANVACGRGRGHDCQCAAGAGPAVDVNGSGEQQHFMRGCHQHLRAFRKAQRGTAPEDDAGPGRSGRLQRRALRNGGSPGPQRRPRISAASAHQYGARDPVSTCERHGRPSQFPQQRRPDREQGHACRDRERETACAAPGDYALPAASRRRQRRVAVLRWWLGPASGRMNQRRERVAGGGVRRWSRRHRFTPRLARKSPADRAPRASRPAPAAHRVPPRVPGSAPTRWP